jgi:CHAT domain-containing protein
MVAIVPLRLFGLMLCIYSFSAAPAAAQTAPNDTVTTQLLLQEATLLNDSARYKIAEAPAQQACDIFRTAGNNERTAEAAYQAGKSLGRQGKTAAAVTLLREAIGIWSAFYPDGAVPMANAWFEIGVAFQIAERMKEALDAHQQCLLLRKRLLPENDRQIAASCLQIGEIIFTIGSQKEAIPYFEKSISINTVVFGPESLVVAEEQSNLGRGWMYFGEYEKAIALTEKALAIQQPVLPPAHIDIIRSYYTLGMCCKHLHRYEDALIYFNKIIALKQKYYPNRPDGLVGTYSQIGDTYLWKKDYQTALSYFEKGDSITKLLQKTGEWSYAYNCNDMARVRFALKDYSQSVAWYQESIQLLRKTYGRDNEEIGILLTEQGKAQTANGNYPEALESFQLAGQVFLNNLGPDNVSQYLSESGMANLYQKMFLRSGDIHDLEKSRTYFAGAQKSIDRLIRFEESPVIRKTWLQDTKVIFGQAIATEMLFQMGKKDPVALENAWQLSETMHGFDLFAASQEANARQYADIPPDFLQQETLLRASMIALQHERQQLIEGQQLPLTDSVVLDNNARYFFEKERYEQLVARFEKDYPNYYQLKYQFRNITIAETQRILGPGQTLLEYFTGDTVIYAFVIGKDSCQMVAIPRDFPLADWVKQFREGIIGAQKSGPAYERLTRQYATSAQQLYQKLIVPVATLLTEETIIILDGELYYLPFEALLSAAPRDVANFKTYPFWVQEKAIGYAYSGTLLHQMITKKHIQQPTGTLLAFAPFFFGEAAPLPAGKDQEMAMRKEFHPLPHTGDEILRAKRQLGGQSALFSGKTATVEQFKALAPAFSILHLATHGKANARAGEFSFLAFYSPSDSIAKGLLYVSDLYNMTINADLALLSACETSLGEMFEGEGVVNLARAFSFAGAKSVVTSLWSINDQSTSYLMDDFYSTLMLGKNKNIALSTAKRQYLKTHPGQQSHPFFWAGFVEVGDWNALK